MPDKDDELGSNLFAEPAAPAPAATPRKVRAKKAAPAKDTSDRVWIVLEESADIPPTGQAFSVNGEVAMVLPGEPVFMQKKYIEVMDHAVISVPTLNASQQVVGTRQRHRFPYRLASPAEIEAATNKS